MIALAMVPVLSIPASVCAKAFGSVRTAVIGDVFTSAPATVFATRDSVDVLRDIPERIAVKSLVPISATSTVSVTVKPESVFAMLAGRILTVLVVPVLLIVITTEIVSMEFVSARLDGQASCVKVGHVWMAVFSAPAVTVSVSVLKVMEDWDVRRGYVHSTAVLEEAVTDSLVLAPVNPVGEATAATRSFVSSDV